MDHAVFYGDGQTWSSMGVGYFSYCDIYPNSTVSCQPWSIASLWRIDGCPSMQQRRSGICWSFQPIQSVFFDATTWWWLSWWWSPLGFHIFQKWLKSFFTVGQYSHFLSWMSQGCWSNPDLLLCKSPVFGWLNHFNHHFRIFNAHLCSSGFNLLVIPRCDVERRQFCVLYFFAIIATSLIGKAEAFQDTRRNAFSTTPH